MSLAARTERVFASGAALPSRWPRYERRDAQVALAVRIAEAIENGDVLVAEAPTGVGKSLAYLTPAVLMALESERRVVVATCTRSLQDQLVERDIPALLEALGVSLPVARLKGKQNYLCPRALDLEDAPLAEESELLEALKRWAADDGDGDLDRFPAADAEGFRRLRARVATDEAACTAATCRRGRECFWVRARREAQEARLVVVNHALLAIAGESEGLLGDFDTLIVDEAHRLEGVLLSQLERSVSRHRIEDLLRLVGSGRGAARRKSEAPAGLIARLREPGAGVTRESAAALSARLADRVAEARADAARFFDQLRHEGSAGPYASRRRYRGVTELVGGDLGALEALLVHCREFSRQLHTLGAEIGSASRYAAELGAECDQVAARFEILGADLEHLTGAAGPEWVTWSTSAGRGVELHAVPVDAGESARRLLTARSRATVLTSATLSVGGQFDFTAGRLGLGESRHAPFVTFAAASPFPLERQIRAYVFDGGRAEAEAVATVVTALAASGRNQLVLFTAHERLKRAREQLLAGAVAKDALLAQEWDGPAGQLSERFRARRGAILLGVQSLWEGVDFPGDALEIVVVAKLPFSVPDDPLVEARSERWRERGEDPFMVDAVPEAVLRFRQGIGRLIRRADDRGVIVVCDPRLATASYRAAFLGALPVPVTVWRDAAALAEDAMQFMAEPLAVKEEA